MCLYIHKLPVQHQGYIVVQKVSKRLTLATRLLSGEKQYHTPYQGIRVPKDGLLLAESLPAPVEEGAFGQSVIYGGYIHSMDRGNWQHYDALALNVVAYGYDNDLCSDAVYIPAVDKHSNVKLVSITSSLRRGRPEYITIKDILPHVRRDVATRLQRHYILDVE